MFVQIIVFIILLVIGFFVFKTDPFKADTKKISLAAIFVVLAVVLKRFSLMIPLFGFPSLQIGFETLPLVIGGMLLGPGYAFLIGLAVDVIGLVIAPNGFPFLGFTLNSVLRPLIPAIWMKHQRHFSEKQIVYGLYAGMLVLSIGASIYVCTLNSITVSKEIIMITSSIKIGTVLLCVGVSLLMILICQYLRKKLDAASQTDLLNWMVIVVVLEVFINFLLTPFWLQTMYGIPWIASLLIRILKACLMVPLSIFIGYSCYEMIKRIVK